MHQARKRFGQNFLHDEGIIHAIVSLIGPSSDIAILEIGPGLGALTKPLLANLESLDLLEIDRDLVAYWRKQNLPGLTITEGDALNFDFLAWARAKKASGVKQIKVVGNLPYNISSPLLFHLVGAATEINEQVFMLQAEVVERMVADAGSSEYSRLSVMLQARYHLEKLLDVPPEAFDPQPKVNSAVSGK